LVMQEVAKGTIALDQPVSRYLPNFKSANANKMTVLQLLRHQSGLPNPDDVATEKDAMSPYYLTGYTGDRHALSGYCAGPVKGPVGGNWSYNNCDYLVVGALLEAVTHTPWKSLVTSRIAKPLGLQTLVAFPTAVQTMPGTIKGAAEPAIDFASFDSAGGLAGTPADLLRIDRALMEARLLRPAQLKILWEGQPDLGFMAVGQWAFEAKLKDCAAPVQLIERRGSIGGVQVRNFIIPGRKTAVVMLSDRSESDFDFGEIWQGSGFSHDVLNAIVCSP
jgi:D-alanyl-D-alanine carboxypeptidase